MVRKFRRRDRQPRTRHPDFSRNKPTTPVKTLWAASCLYEPVDSPLLREWEGPVNIKAGLNFQTGLPNDFCDQIDSEIVRRLGRAIPWHTSRTENKRNFRFRKKVRLELICHVIMNLCPGCLAWDAQKMYCTADDRE